MISIWLWCATGDWVETGLRLPTLSRMIQLASVAWSGHLTVLGGCFSRLARSIIDRSFRAGYRGEVKPEPASRAS